MDWSIPVDDKTLAKTIKALKKKGITAVVAGSKDEAKKMVVDMVPKGAEVMLNTSTTFMVLGLDKIFNESGDYKSVNNAIRSEQDEKKRHELRKRAVLADYSMGSAHAVTQKGEIVWASQSGSQIAPYAYSANHVILVIGTQKIVKNLPQALKRIKEYSFNLENERAMKAYGKGTGLNRILIIENEPTPERIKIVFVKENIGF